jgi:hypothetical protein
MTSKLLGIGICWILLAPQFTSAQPQGMIYKEEFHPSFKGNPKQVAGLKVFGTQKSSVTYEGDALRITLPTGSDRPRAGDGVVTTFGVKGDFEITAGFEIVSEPASKPIYPTDFKLVVVPYDEVVREGWYRSNQNRASIAREFPHVDSAGGFCANTTQWTPGPDAKPHTVDKWGRPTTEKIEPEIHVRAGAETKSGVLCLVRSGGMLSFLYKDGADKNFRRLHESAFGTKDIKNVRLLAFANAPSPGFDVRVTGLTIRADAFPKMPETAFGPFEFTRQDFSPKMPVRTKVLIGIALFMAALLVIGIVWRFVLKRPNSAPASSTEASSGNKIDFFCSQCGTPLKIKAELAGGQVKCPNCNTINQVPQAEKLS